MTPNERWDRYCRYFCNCAEVGVSLDISRMNFADDLFTRYEKQIARSFAAMADLEGGAIANPDENRMVGHYWLRNANLAPNAELRKTIEDTRAQIKQFSADVHSGKIAPPSGGRYEHVLAIGIGGSALGPQFVNDALGGCDVAMNAWFFDNTDPDGFDRTLNALGDDLARTLVLVISKSGGTKETRNGMLEAMHAFKARGLDFAKQAVAVTGDGSALHKVCQDEGWITMFPMWDWVGGRTSQTAAVGVLPAALQGFDVDALLDGARKMDDVTRIPDAKSNPAMLLALMWYDAAQRGLRDMVILPYKDRLMLFARYLQQLVMESLGKGADLDGNAVLEGIAVYGNKGSTDQHAYVQQLREGLNNFHATFIEVLCDRDGDSIEVEPGVTSGDYLGGFLAGTRTALTGNGRESITITVNAVSPGTVGSLIALYERAVGYYATMANINAYHQPGVEAGKKAASEVIALQPRIREVLGNGDSNGLTTGEIAERINATDQAEDIYRILRRWSHNPNRGVRRVSGETPESARFSRV